MKDAVLNNGELLTSLVTIIVGGVVRYFEKKKLKKQKLLFDTQKEASDYNINDDSNTRIIGKNF